jgi:hypothetical protein
MTPPRYAWYGTDTGPVRTSIRTITPLIVTLAPSSLPPHRPKELPHDCVVEVVSEVVADTAIIENRRRLSKAAKAALKHSKGSKSQSQRSREKRDEEWEEKKEERREEKEERREERRRKSEEITDNAVRRKRIEESQETNFLGVSSDAGASEEFDDNGLVAETDDVSDFEVDPELSSKEIPKRFDLHAAYRDLTLDPEDLSRFRGTFVRNITEPKKEVFRKRGSSATRQRGRQREEEKRILLEGGVIDRKRVSMDYGKGRSTSTSRDSRLRSRSPSCTVRPPAHPYSPLALGNYYPLRNSSPQRSGPLHGPKDLKERNATSVSYILADSEPDYEEALTAAVETVVTNFFR